MTAAAAAAGVSRIVYLGGLGDDAPRLSHHLRSRREVGDILQGGPVPVTTLPCGHDHRLGERLLRDPAVPGRSPAGDDHAAMDRHPLPADRDHQRPALPGRLPRLPGNRRPVLRHRSGGGVHLPGPDAPVRGGGAPAAALDPPGAGAHPAPVLLLDPPGDAGAGRPGSSARGRAAQPGGMPRHRDTGTASAAAARLQDGHPPGVGEDAPPAGGKLLDGCRPAAARGVEHRRRPAVGGRHDLPRRPAHAGRGFGPAMLAGSGGHRGEDRLVLRRLALAIARSDRPHARRPRHRPRDGATCACRTARRRARFLEGPRGGAGAPAEARRRR